MFAITGSLRSFPGRPTNVFPATHSTVPLLWATLLVAAPLTEETLFRGFDPVIPVGLSNVVAIASRRL